MAEIHRRGQRGESLVAAYLAGRGWTVVHRNWRFHHRELDLVVARDGVVAFVEVKTRSEAGLGHPLDAVTTRKRRDLAIAARGWIAEHGAGYRAFRFDAATVVIGAGGIRVEHIPDAWRL